MVGFTNGCFDLLHPGHIAILRGAERLCDRLIVGLNADDSVSRLNGPTRLVQGRNSPRLGPRCADPDVLIKGADDAEDQIVGADIVRGGAASSASGSSRGVDDRAHPTREAEPRGNEGALGVIVAILVAGLIGSNIVAALNSRGATIWFFAIDWARICAGKTCHKRIFRDFVPLDQPSRMPTSGR
jgi:cytidyltransferase-like protein